MTLGISNLFLDVSLARFNNWAFGVGANPSAVSTWSARSKVYSEFAVPVCALLGVAIGFCSVGGFKSDVGTALSAVVSGLVLGGITGKVIAYERSASFVESLNLNNPMTRSQCRTLALIEAVEMVALPILGIVVCAAALSHR